MDAGPIVRALTPGGIAEARDVLLRVAVRAKGTWGYDDAFMARFARETVEELEALARAADPPGDTDPPGTTDPPGRSVVLVAEAGTELVGYAVLRDRGDHAWLDDLWVDPDHQGRGAGRALWDAACARARDWGRVRLEVEADPNAEAFYQRMGARTIGQRASTYAAGRLLPLLRIDLG